MNLPLFHCHCHHQSSHKQHVGVLQIVPSSGVRGKDAQGGEEHKREKGSGGNGNYFCHPIHTDYKDDIECSGGLERQNCTM